MVLVLVLTLALIVTLLMVQCPHLITIDILIMEPRIWRTSPSSNFDPHIERVGPFHHSHPLQLWTPLALGHFTRSLSRFPDFELFRLLDFAFSRFLDFDLSRLCLFQISFRNFLTYSRVFKIAETQLSDLRRRGDSLVVITASFKNVRMPLECWVIELKNPRNQILLKN